MSGWGRGWGPLDGGEGELDRKPEPGTRPWYEETAARVTGVPAVVSNRGPDVVRIELKAIVGREKLAALGATFHGASAVRRFEIRTQEPAP
jgi:hypothetical protein